MFFKNNFKSLYFLLLCLISSHFILSLITFATEKNINNKNKVGLLIVATGKYIQFVEPLITSAEKYFCQDHDVTYFIFTDGKPPQSEKIIHIYQKRLGWPYDTMMRFKMYYEQKELLSTQDYLFACDADMLFVDTVGSEIFGDLVGTQHPGFVNKRGSYETRPESTAYVRKNEGIHYFAGGFYGGNQEHFFALLKSVIKNIETDQKNNIIAVWHDESHLNRYFIDHKPTTILTPSYCYPESWKLPYQKKLLALDKNHNAMRKQ